MIFFFKFIFFSLVFWINLHAQTPPSTAAFHLNSEPATLDPHLQKSSAAGYALDNLYRNLLWLTPQGELKPDLAENCQRSSSSKKKNFQIICKLKPNLKWSNGSALTSKDFLRSYERLLHAKTQSRRADLFFPIVNAEEYYRGETDFKNVGIQAPDEKTISFTLKAKTPEFEYSLTGFYTAPSPEEALIGKLFSGPYQVKEWKKNQYFLLEQNKYYVAKPDLTLPNVKFMFVPEDSVAFKLYQKNQLQFLRRLLTHLIPQFQKSSEYFSIPIFRFDYLGFGEYLKNQPDLRKALALSLPYDELTQLFHSKGQYGCAGLPDSFFESKAPCYQYDLAAAKAALQKSKWPLDKPLQIIYSTQGGEDHQKLATWLQIQWKKNLGLQLEIKAVESKIYMSKVKNEKQYIFRRGVAPDRVSCAAALEPFRQDDSENLLKHFHLDLDQRIEKLNGLSLSESKKLCTALVTQMMDQYVFIPAGAFEFSILAKPQLKNWSLNQLNQLDLSQLQLTQ